MKNVIYIKDWIAQKAQAEIEGNLRLELARFRATYRREPQLDARDPYESALAEWVVGNQIAKRFDYWEEPEK
jgi:hypothetical protein